MILVKIHKAEERIILCLCDKDLIGKKFQDKDLVLDIKEEFYRGREIDESIKQLIYNAGMINAVGNESIQLLINEKIISKRGIKKIAGIPHAQVIY